jgi:hypothetical protein
MHKMLMFILMYYLLDDKNYNIRFTSARQSYDVLSATQSELYPLTWHKRLSCNRNLWDLQKPVAKDPNKIQACVNSSLPKQHGGYCMDGWCLSGSWPSSS